MGWGGGRGLKRMAGDKNSSQGAEVAKNATGKETSKLQVTSCTNFCMASGALSVILS